MQTEWAVVSWCRGSGRWVAGAEVVGGGGVAGAEDVWWWGVGYLVHSGWAVGGCWCIGCGRWGVVSGAQGAWRKTGGGAAGAEPGSTSAYSSTYRCR